MATRFVDGTEDGWREDPEPVTGFNVTCVIGRVEFDELSEFGPTEAAMLLIARHDTDGVFTFPLSDGRTMEVQVRKLDPNPGY